MRILFLYAAMILACVSQPVLADDSGAYLGGGLAATSVLSSFCSYGGYTSCNQPSNGPTSGTPFGVIAGYDFNRHFGVEAGETQLGTFSVKNIAGTTVGNFKASATTFGFKAGGFVSDNLSIFGKFGLASVNTKYVNKAAWVLNGEANQRTTGKLIGVAGQYDVNDIVGFRMSLDMIQYSDAEFENSIESVSMMAVFRL